MFLERLAGRLARPAGRLLISAHRAAHPTHPRVVDVGDGGAWEWMLVAGVVAMGLLYRIADVHRNKTKCVRYEGSTFVGTLVGLYGLLIAVLGIVFPLAFFLSGAGKENNLYLTVFHMYIYIVSIVYMIYTDVYIWRYVSRTHKEKRHSIPNTQRLPNQTPDDGEKEREGQHREVIIIKKNTNKAEENSLLLPEVEEEEIPPFAHVSAGVNFYLRLGTIVFAAGHFVLDCLQIAQFGQTEAAWFCYGGQFIAIVIMRVVFTIWQTMFLYRNHRLVLNFNKGWMKFGLLHLIVTNICVWTLTVIMEAGESFFSHHDTHDNSSYVTHAYHPEVTTMATVHSASSSQDICHQSSTLADSASPYLYPCVIEYSLIAAAVFCKIYTNVGATINPNVLQNMKDLHKFEPRNCCKGNIGLLAGLIVLSMTIVGTCFFVTYKTADPISDPITVLVYYGTDIAVNILSFIAVGVAFWRRMRLSFTTELESKFDQNLILVALFGLFIFSSFLILPYLLWTDEVNLGTFATLQVCDSFITIIQAIMQVVFIIDGLRIHATRSQDLQNRPGRNCITFLLMCNLAMWVINTFMLKEAHNSYIHSQFFGSLALSIIIHTCLALTIFFRFHSSICLSDIYLNTYKKEEDHIQGCV